MLNSARARAIGEANPMRDPWSPWTIEFVPKDDSQVQRMLASRADIFDGYTQEQFERAFAAFFDILAVTALRDSRRSLYLMRHRPA